MDKQKIVIVGRGAFGVLMAKHLRPYAQVVFVRRSDKPEQVEKKIKHADMVIFSVPFVGLEQSIKHVKQFISDETDIVDVMSVKQRPLALLKKHFPKNPILGTHPIFGPQSARYGIAGLPMVLCNVSFSQKKYSAVKKFLKNDLKLKLIEQTAKQHDHEMAHVQGLTHFVGRALKEIDIQSYTTNTKSYEQLLELRDLLIGDSWELFETIQNTNPEAKQVRKKFVRELDRLNSRLEK